MPQRTMDKKAWVGRFRVSVILVAVFSLLTSMYVFPSEAKAAPIKTYRWNATDSINMAAGSGEKGSGTLVPYDQDPTNIYHGSFKSTNKSWLGLSEETCTTDIWIKLDSNNSATTIPIAAPSQSPYPGCRDMPGIGAKIHIDGIRPQVAEKPEKKILTAIVFGDPKGKPIVVVIKQNGKVVKRISTQRLTSDSFIGRDTLEQGQYTAECAPGLPFDCGIASFEKKFNIEARVYLGQSTDSKQLTFHLFVDCSVVQGDPTQLLIFNDKGKKVTTVPVTSGVPADSPKPDNIYYTGCLHMFKTDPVKLANGEYTACIFQRQWCAPFTKVFAQGGVVDLLFGFEAIPDDDPVCVGGMMGWLLCPVAEFTKNFSQTAAKIIEGLLFVEPLTLNTTSSNPIYTIWAIVRDISNIVFIILFLMIVFSQSTGLGMSNYGIKRLLPRLIIMAILVNISYYVCAFAIDIFNLMGAGVKGLIQVGIDAAPTPNLGKEHWDGSFAGFYTAIFAAIFALFVSGQVWTLAAFVFVAVALSVLTGFVVLVFRQVMIVLLVILSPLAFAAALLPNTEEWYQRWRKTFTSMLLSYPVMMFVYYGSVLVAAVVGATMLPK